MVFPAPVAPENGPRHVDPARFWDFNSPPLLYMAHETDFDPVRHRCVLEAFRTPFHFVVACIQISEARSRSNDQGFVNLPHVTDVAIDVTCPLWTLTRLSM